MAGQGRNKGYEERLFFLPLPAFGDGLAADAPVVGLDFFDDYARGLRVLPQNVLEHFGHALDKMLLLFGGGTFFRDLDIHVWHDVCLLSLFVYPASRFNRAAAAASRR